MTDLLRGRPLFWLPIGLIGILGCGQRNQYFEPPPPEVTVATPRQQDVTQYLEITGMTQPVVSVDVRARVRGFLQERHFEEGSLVEKGQLLLVIDEEPFRLRSEQAAANLAEAQSTLRKAEQSRSRELAKAKLALDEAALLQAKSNEDRLRKLLSGRTVTEDEFERGEALRKQASAQVESSRVALVQAEADFETDILTARAAAAAAQTAARNAKIELDYCRMTAPISGRITETYHDVGNLVGDGQASLLATIVQIDPIHVYMTLSERDFLAFQQSGGESSKAARVEMGLDGDQYPHQGTIDYRDPAIDSGTGTIRMRGLFANPRGEILPGTFARLRLALDQQHNALLVPERALGTDQSGQYLLVAGKDDVVEYRAVKVGSRVGDLRVVEGPIGPQDRVIVEGLLRARPNMKVVPKPAAAAVNNVAGGGSAAHK
ncbi:MAG: efflux RND transporter periplasmic adaptor subunit [Pirellulales bacterium]